MNARSGRTFYPTLDGAPTGRVGTMTLAIEWPDNSVAQAASALNIVESSSGSYTATRTAPVVTEETTFILVWHDTELEESATEDLIVSALGSITDGLFYCSATDVRQYVGVTEDQLPDATINPYILRAQRDIDAACGYWPRQASTGLKFVTTDEDYPEILTDEEVEILALATAAQVEYRMEMGDDFMVKEQYEAQSGPGYSVTGTLRKVCGASYTFLQQGGFLNLNGQASRRSTVWDLPRAN